MFVWGSKLYITLSDVIWVGGFSLFGKSLPADHEISTYSMKINFEYKKLR